MTEQWQELKETITELRDNDGTGTQQEVSKFLVNLMDVLEKKMSSSEKPSQWIPCSERLPEEKDAGIQKKLGINTRSDYVIATVDVKGARMTVTACTHDGKWNWNMKYAFPDFKVVAWTPFPEPYKEESRG